MEKYIVVEQMMDSVGYEPTRIMGVFSSEDCFTIPYLNKLEKEAGIQFVSQKRTLFAHEVGTNRYKLHITLLEDVKDIKIEFTEFTEYFIITECILNQVI